MLLSRRVLRTLSDASFGLFVLTVTTAAALSCAALLSQAVRSARHRSWARNFNAFVIGAAYAIVVCPSRIPHNGSDIKSASSSCHWYFVRTGDSPCETGYNVSQRRTGRLDGAMFHRSAGFVRCPEQLHSVHCTACSQIHRTGVHQGVSDLLCFSSEGCVPRWLGQAR